MKNIYTTFTFKDKEKGKVIAKGHIAEMSTKDMLLNFIEIVFDTLVSEDSLKVKKEGK